MRYLSSPIWARWRKGRYIGNNRARLIVTHEPDWWLTLSSHTNKDNFGTLGVYTRGPVRWWQRADSSQYEREVPNVISLNWNRSTDTPIADAKIVIANNVNILTGVGTPAGSARVGDPGYYSPRRGGLQKRPVRLEMKTHEVGNTPVTPYKAKPDRWGQAGNSWYGAFNAGSVFRTYEGYGPASKDWQEAIEDGDVVLTGVWMCDEVSVTHTGQIEMKCRGVAGPILADQRLYSNSDEGIVPRTRYPVRYNRWTYGSGVRPGAGTPGQIAVLGATYQASSADQTYPDLVDYSRGLYGRGAPVHGHYPDEACDENNTTFWLSEGYAESDSADARPWVEFYTGKQICNYIRLNTINNGYQIYVSVMENAAWAAGPTIPYTAPGAGTNINANIPYVKSFSVPAGTPTTVALPRTFYAERVRLTFRKLHETQWGPSDKKFRAGVREFNPVRNTLVPTGTPGSASSGTIIAVGSKEPGNYKDYTDVVKDLLLWSGYWLLPDAQPDGRHRANGVPRVYGNIETTGAYSEEHLPAEMFDKRPPLDVITEIADVVSYMVMEGPEGEIHFHSRNMYRPGNHDENGRFVYTIPELHDSQLLMDHSPVTSITPLRSGITISSAEPTSKGDDIVTTRFRPDFKTLMRGIRKPAIWVNGFFIKESEQKRMAELTALRMWMAAHGSRATAPGNPLLSPDDQVRLVDKLSSTDDIYYIRSISSNHDRRSGVYTMDFDLNLLGQPDSWVVGVVSEPPSWRTRQKYLVRDGDDWDIILRRLQGRYYPDAVNLAQIKKMNTDQVPLGDEPTPGMWLDV